MSSFCRPTLLELCTVRVNHMSVKGATVGDGESQHRKSSRTFAHFFYCRTLYHYNLITIKLLNLYYLNKLSTGGWDYMCASRSLGQKEERTGVNWDFFPVSNDLLFPYVLCLGRERSQEEGKSHLRQGKSFSCVVV